MDVKDLPRISVIVITYNQEKLIGRALDSILIQANWGLKDIIVCDDCSTDNNWQVIFEYAEKYPNYIRAYKNISNMGIYGNLQQALTYLEDTDLVYMCSGDDAFCDGLFKGAVQVIKNKKIDLKNDLFAIYCDWKMMYPNGEEKIYKNDLIAKGYNAVSLKIRGLVENRSMGVSINVYKKYLPVPLDKGVSVAESLFDTQVEILSQKNYYLPIVGSIYYAGIGVSTKMNDKKSLLNMIEANKELLKALDLSLSDRYFLHFLIETFHFRIHKSTSRFFKVWFYYFISIKYRTDFVSICKMMGYLLLKPVLQKIGFYKS